MGTDTGHAAVLDTAHNHRHRSGRGVAELLLRQDDKADGGRRRGKRHASGRAASAIEDSKAVSYEGIVRQAYRDYQHTHNRVGVYRTVTEYLSQKPSKMDKIDEALAAMTQKLEQLPPDEAEEH